MYRNIDKDPLNVSSTRWEIVLCDPQVPDHDDPTKMRGGNECRFEFTGSKRNLERFVADKLAAGWTEPKQG